MTNTTEYHIDQFLKFEKMSPGSIPFSVSFDFKKHKGHVVFGFIVHGNEVGPLAALTQAIVNLFEQKLNYGGKVTFFLGNVPAAQKNVRFVEADLNRSFGSSQTQSQERKRACEIMTLLQTCDVFFDFHQTIMPSYFPFYIFPMHEKSYLWARAAGTAQSFVTRKMGQPLSALGMCTDEFVRSLDKVGVTVELGEQGFRPECELLANQIIRRTLHNADKVFLRNVPIKKLAQKNEDFRFFSVRHRESFGHPLKRLNPGFCNFHKVTRGMVLGADEKGNPLECAQDGFLLFPKYPVRNEKNEAVLPLPGELFVIMNSQQNTFLCQQKNT